MFHGPIGRRFAAALVLAIGLLAVFAAPTLAQDLGTPPADDPGVQAAAAGTGSLHLLAYLCDGYAQNVPSGLSFDVASPGDPNPDKPVAECDPTSSVDGTDMTFEIWLFGDEAQAQPVTVTDGDVTVPDLPETTGLAPHRIVEQLTQDQIDNGEQPIWADFDITADVTTGINAIVFQTGSVDLRAYTCQGDPADTAFDVLDPGAAFDDAPYQSCATADLDFALTPFGNATDFTPQALSTVDGVASAEDVPTTSATSGPHAIANEASGATATFDVAAGKATVVVFVQYEAPTGTLAVTKIACTGNGETQFFVDEVPGAASDPSCAPASEGFTVYPFGDAEAVGIGFETDANGEQTVSGLPVTDADPHLLVEDATQAQQAFDIAAGETTTVYVVNFTPAEAQTGTVEIEALLCDGIDDPQLTVGDPGDDPAAVPAGCESTTADVEILPYGDDANDPIPATVDGSESVELPVTDGQAHLLTLLVDGDAAASAGFEIAADRVTPVQVLLPNPSEPVEQVGSVALYSYVCTGDGDTGFEVWGPGEAPDLPSDCDPLNRTFTISLFGDGETVLVATGDAGQAVVTGVPVTLDVPHEIANQDGSLAASFEVAADTETSVVYTVWEAEDDATDDSSDSENVDELADTGIGPAATGGDASTMVLFGLLSLGAVVALAGLTRRQAA